MDIVSQLKRSQMMSGIQGKNTKPELQIRKSLFKRGFRYRIYSKKLPGKPDIILKKWNAVIFVNGCFWHGHSCDLFKWPSTREDFWKEKINSTVIRDSRNIQELQKRGWKIVVVWDAQLEVKNV